MLYNEQCVDYGWENAKIKSKNRVTPWNARSEWISHPNTTSGPIQKFDLLNVSHLAECIHCQLAWETPLGLLSFPAKTFCSGSEGNTSFINPSSGAFFTRRLWQFHVTRIQLKMKTLHFISVGMLLTSNNRKLWLCWLYKWGNITFQPAKSLETGDYRFGYVVWW